MTEPSAEAKMIFMKILDLNLHDAAWLSRRLRHLFEEDEPDAGVREPRRPRYPAGSIGAMLEERLEEEHLEHR